MLVGKAGRRRRACARITSPPPYFMAFNIVVPPCAFGVKGTRLRVSISVSHLFVLPSPASRTVANNRCARALCSFYRAYARGCIHVAACSPHNAYRVAYALCGIIFVAGKGLQPQYSNCFFHSLQSLPCLYTLCLCTHTLHAGDTARFSVETSPHDIISSSIFATHLPSTTPPASFLCPSI